MKTLRLRSTVCPRSYIIWSQRWWLSAASPPLERHFQGFVKWLIACLVQTRSAEDIMMLRWKQEAAWNSIHTLYKTMTGTSLAVQWLKFCTSTAGDVGSIPDRETVIPCAVHSHTQNFFLRWWANVTLRLCTQQTLRLTSIFTLTRIPEIPINPVCWKQRKWGLTESGWFPWSRNCTKQHWASAGVQGPQVGQEDLLRRSLRDCSTTNRQQQQNVWVPGPS